MLNQDTDLNDSERWDSALPSLAPCVVFHSSTSVEVLRLPNRSGSTCPGLGAYSRYVPAGPGEPQLLSGKLFLGDSTSKHCLDHRHHFGLAGSSILERAARL